MDKHWIWLTTRKGIGVRGRKALLDIFGTAERIYELNTKDYLSTEGFEQRWLEPLCDKALDGAEAILKSCDEYGIHILTYAQEEYPERLRNIPDPPTLLYYKGNFPNFDKEAAIAVVGSRKCSAYGLLHAKQFAKLIATSGGLVVSGGARGIDTMALRGALDSQMPVACVLACGLDIAYPNENRYLFRDIEHHGCMISEYPPGTPPERGNFPVRNRIISGLSLGVLVVEAPEKSGALITAQQALEQGRDVFAIPGNIGVKHCAGSNALLREGAIMVEDGWDVLKEYTYLFPEKLSDGRRAEAIERVYRARFSCAQRVYSPVSFQRDDDKKVVDNPPMKIYSDEKGQETQISSDEQSILVLLAEQPVHSDELTAKSGLPAFRVASALTLLQIKGFAEKCNGNYYRKKSQ